MVVGSGAIAASELDHDALAALGKYMDVQFIWDATQSGNLLFTVPYTDVDGTARVQPTLYINLATLFETTAGGAQDPAVGSAVGTAQETHDNTFTAVGALTAAEAKALKMRSVIWVDADPTGGTDMIGSLAGSPGTWVIVFPTFISTATSILGGHVGAMANIGEITRAELAGVNRLTVNFVNSGVGGGAASGVFTVQGSRNTFIVNLMELILANQIDADCH